MRSIRGTLTRWLLAALGLLVLASGLAVFFGIRGALTRQFDETLTSRTAALISATSWDGTHVEVDFTAAAMPWYEPGPDAEYFRLTRIAPDGAPNGTVKVSPSLGDRRWLVPELAGRHDAVVNAPLPDGRAGRVAVVQFRPHLDEELAQGDRQDLRDAAAASTPRLRLFAGMTRRPLDRSMRILATGLAGAGLAMAVGAAAVVGLSLSRGLRPLSRLSTDVSGIGAESLSRRLRDDDLPAELRPICTRINDLLDRLQEAFEREQRFTAAAAHELRTPVAELRTMIEVALSRERTAAEASRTLEEALVVVLQMDKMVSSLFTLVRHGPAVSNAELDAIDPVPVLARVARRHEPAAHARGGSITVEAPTGVRVQTDAALLDLILGNLIANAVEYASPPATVRCVVGADPGVGAGHIDVFNAVENLTNDQIRDFWEPFYRRNSARSDRSHLGLGLALSRQFARAMGADLQISLETPETIRARLTLSLAAAYEATSQA